MDEKIKNDATVDTGCLKAQKIASKFGFEVDCGDKKEEAKKELVDPNCGKAQKIAGKFGFQVDCEVVEIKES